MIAFLASLLSLGREVYADLRKARELEDVKRDARDRLDVAIDKAAALARLERRSKK
jgi:hypothetical protein